MQGAPAISRRVAEKATVDQGRLAACIVIDSAALTAVIARFIGPEGAVCQLRITGVLAMEGPPSNRNVVLKVVYDEWTPDQMTTGKMDEPDILLSLKNIPDSDRGRKKCHQDKKYAKPAPYPLFSFHTSR